MVLPTLRERTMVVPSDKSGSAMTKILPRRRLRCTRDHLSAVPGADVDHLLPQTDPDVARCFESHATGPPKTS